MDKKYIWEFEEEKIEKQQQENERLRKNKEEKRKKKRKKKIINISIIFLVFIFLIFTPFFKVNKIQVKGNFFFNSQTIIDDINIDERFSVFSYIKGRIKDKKSLYYLDEAKVGYNIKSGETIINVKEKTPLYHDENGQNYYVDQKQRVGMWDISYQTPLIYSLEFEIEVPQEVENVQQNNDQGSTQENTQENTNEVKTAEVKTVKVNLLDEVLDQLELLDYNIRIQIKSIQLADFEVYGKNVLKFNMQDGNTVYIYPYQIKDKMQYYNQMKEILDQNKKPTGNIYLYIGDYYEPYK